MCYHKDNLPTDQALEFFASLLCESDLDLECQLPAQAPQQRCGLRVLLYPNREKQCKLFTPPQPPGRCELLFQVCVCFMALANAVHTQEIVSHPPHVRCEGRMEANQYSVKCHLSAKWPCQCAAQPCYRGSRFLPSPHSRSQF